MTSEAVADFFYRLKQRPLYPALAVLMIFIALAGFGPESVLMLLRHDVPPYAVVHMHAVVFSGWLLLFFLQAAFAATGRMEWHRRLGTILLVYVGLMFVLGVLVTLNRFAYELRLSDLADARTANLAPTVDMLAFPPLFFLAWFYRHKPEIHKRLMVVAATILLYAAVVRIYPVRRSHSMVLTMAVWSLPIVVGVAYDLLVRKALYRTYVFGLMVVIVLSLRPELENSTPWKGATNWLAQELTRHS